MGRTGAIPTPSPSRPPCPRTTRSRQRPPVDGVEAFPDVVASGPPPLLHAESDPDDDFRGRQRAHLRRASGDREYRLPDRALPGREPADPRGLGRRERAHGVQVLVQTLAHFGVEATVVGTIAGLRVVRYELQLAPGTKVSKVAGLGDDLSYALATTEIRILAPIPGRLSASRSSTSRRGW